MFCCPACLRSRRVFLAADAPTSNAPAQNPAAPDPPALATPTPAPGVPAAAGLRWIDVHCHVFNAIDLPMSEFIDRTRLSSKLDLPIWVLVAILAGGLQKAAPSASAEAAQLDTQDATPPAPPPARDIETALRAMAAPQVAAPGAATRYAPVPSRGNAVLREALGLPADDGGPLTDAQYAQLVAHLQSDGGLLDTMAWANSFALPRNTLIDHLLEQFDPGTRVMLTPALVDYNRWLGITDGSLAEQAMTSMQNQLQVMAAIARWRAREQGLPVFAFAPFDPWRYIEDRKANRPDMLTVAGSFIEDGSIVGFKLYPPMGFAPAANAEVPDAWFPQALQDLAGPHVGVALDQAMDDLFAYCVAGDVPIMAHCANSEFPAAADDQAPPNAWGATPGFWDRALAKYPTLRLNLGHFGGVWDFGAGARQPATPQDQQDQQTAQQWARDIVDMMVNKPYPNLYADVAFASSMLPARGGAERQAAWVFLHDMLGGNPALGQRLMYGSDWEMVGQAADGNDYARHLLANVADLFPGAAIEDFRWRNAARFLGLGATDRTRARLAKFLSDNAADPAILAPFDPATA